MNSPMLFVKTLNQIFFGKLYNVELIARIKCNPLYKTTLRIYRKVALQYLKRLSKEYSIEE
jgi:hypothetical protein